MKEFNISNILSDSGKMNEIREHADRSKNEQVTDIKRGNKKASNSFGKRGGLNARSDEVRSADAFIGAMAECIAAYLTKTDWTKETLQYDGNTNPDLRVLFNNQITDAEVRGGRNPDKVIIRPYYSNGQARDFNDTVANDLLVAVTNLPRGPIVRVGFKKFGDLKTLCAGRPEWYVDNGMGPPFYYVPIEEFESDWNLFTDFSK